MSYRATTWAWEKSTGTSKTAARNKLVLLAMADATRGDDGVCFAFRETIAETCNISLSAVDRALADLLELNLIGRRNQRRKARGRFSSSEFVLNLRDESPFVVCDERSPFVVCDEPLLVSEPSRSSKGSYEPLRGPKSKPKNGRKPDVVWDTFVVLYGPVTNRSSRGRRNGAVKAVRQSLEASGLAEVGWEDEIRARFIRLRDALNPDAWEKATEVALATRWDSLSGQTKGGVVDAARFECPHPECRIRLKTAEKLEDHVRNVHGMVPDEAVAA